jgi:regulatory protein
MSRPKPELSLKARALRFLAAREHSRLELSRKLARHSEDAEEIERVLDDFAARGWLSAARFAESVAHRRASRYGNARIRQELQQHGVEREVAAPVLAALQSTELERATALWQQRFGQPPRDLAERARQQRFLLARGFSGDTVRRVLRDAAQGAADDPSSAPPDGPHDRVDDGDARPQD